ncbi:hypothetical protein MHC_03150 [Mycoplasma haemocanis str. Illinois]|uniref:Uncharacterized protein n=1 Tax=Mycoplasma haemocanis (strain Illinois) TaxID=1111676 RepID=H6N768_MYCHN|nr:hypothetical protein [Mycoplasma haemocanis]AEW45490.1 hypothetical protein MHC_03150 [Mycoplasma haemocanis str. Illinois]
MEYWRIGASLLGVGGATAGGYLAYPHIFKENKRTILNELQSRDKLPIDRNDSQWTLKRDIYNKGSHNFKITLKGIERTNITVEELKEWCSNSLKETYSKEKSSILSKVEKWCLKPNIREALSKESKGLIPFDGDTANTQWSTKLNSGNGKIKSELIDKWGLTPTTSNGNTVSAETLREGCKQKIEGEYISETDENYTLSKSWCLSN